MCTWDHTWCNGCHSWTYYITNSVDHPRAAKATQKPKNIFFTTWNQNSETMFRKKKPFSKNHRRKNSVDFGDFRGLQIRGPKKRQTVKSLAPKWPEKKWLVWDSYVLLWVNISSLVIPERLYVNLCQLIFLECIESLSTWNLTAVSRTFHRSHIARSQLLVTRHKFLPIRNICNMSQRVWHHHFEENMELEGENIWKQL